MKIFLIFMILSLFLMVNAEFNEEFSISPLNKYGHVLIDFKFSLDWDGDTSGIVD